MESKTALIFGISGQDGAYLAHLLLSQGYRVVGASRDAEMAKFENLHRLGIRERVQLCSASPVDFRSILTLLTATLPDEVYNLAGQSSVALSFDQPVETFDSVTVATLNILECIRFSKLPTRLFNAVSSDCFGMTGTPANEDTPFRPRSPYGMAKAAAYWTTRTYREAYGIYCCAGILSNHESPLRPERFVCRKIVSTAVRIAQGSKERLSLGNIDIRRDWGLAAEYVHMMWYMLQQSAPDDYVIATGETCSLGEFIDAVFSCLNLDSRNHLETKTSLLRPLDIPVSRLDPSKAREKLGWTAKYRMRELASLLVRCEIDRSPGPLPWVSGA